MRRRRAKPVGPTDEAASNEWQDPTLAGKIGDRKAAVCMVKRAEHPGYAGKRLFFDDEQVDESVEEEIAARHERHSLEQFHVFPAKL